jgi:hypothetical protein
MADEITPAADPAYNPADPSTRQTPVDNPPDGKPLNVTYYPAPGDPDTVTAYGKTFKAGEAIEVDPHHRAKVAGNPHFSIEGQRSAGDAERDAKAEPEVESEDDNLTFEENVVANRIEEYDTADPVAAENMRRLGETSFDRPLHGRRRPGRPSKEDLRARQQQQEAAERAAEHDAEMADIAEEKSADEAKEEQRQAEIERAQMEQRANRGVTK